MSSFPVVSPDSGRAVDTPGPIPWATQAGVLRQDMISIGLSWGRLQGLWSLLSWGHKSQARARRKTGIGRLDIRTEPGRGSRLRGPRGGPGGRDRPRQFC